MNVLIREAKIGDCLKISCIIKDSMGYDNPPRLIRQNLERLLSDKKDKILVAVADDELVGVIHREDYNCLYFPPLKDLMTFAVKNEYQHKYIGTRLLEEIEAWAKDTGRAGVRVLSSSTRTFAHSFYKAKGYATNKTQFNFLKLF